MTRQVCLVVHANRDDVQALALELQHAGHQDAFLFKEFHQPAGFHGRMEK